ncbi:MAG: cytochrome c, partial [Desulfobacterales bacterium]
VALLPAAILGFMDWQHFYGGAWLFPIQMKYGLAATLLIFLLVAIYWGKKSPKGLKTLIAYLFCLLSVTGLGYFGGELVYGTKKAPEEMSEGLAKEGARIFNQKCVFCHDPGTTDSRVGPGLKGLFQRETLHKSRWPVTEANVRKQLATPFEAMPPLGTQSKETVDALMAYLKTL